MMIQKEDPIEMVIILSDGEEDVGNYFMDDFVVTKDDRCICNKCKKDDIKLSFTFIDSGEGNARLTNDIDEITITETCNICGYVNNITFLDNGPMDGSFCLTRDDGEIAKLLCTKDKNHESHIHLVTSQRESTDTSSAIKIIVKCQDCGEITAIFTCITQHGKAYCM